MDIGVEEREVAVLLIALGCLWASVAMWRPLARVPGAAWLFASGVAFVVGALATVVEGVVPAPVGAVLDGVEHVAFLANACLLLGWAWRHWREEPAS